MVLNSIYSNQEIAKAMKSLRALSAAIGQVIITDFEHADSLKSLLGSCVGLTLYDPISKTGGIAHIMMPRKTGQAKILGEENQLKYADIAIPFMVNKFMNYYIDLRNIEAKIAGGASMFPLINSENSIFNIGKQNVTMTIEKLKEAKIPIVGSDTGKSYGRVMTLYLDDGRVEVRETLSGQIVWI